MSIVNLQRKRLTEIPSDINIDTTRLLLAHNNISFIPPEIGNLTNLTHLLLSNNKITQLPREIGNLRDLTELSLSNNELTQLPPELWNLRNLTELSLSNNKITKLPADIGNLTDLTTLYLQNNEFKHIPDDIGKLINLKYLNISKNLIKKIPTTIGNLTQLESLNVSNNKLNNLPNEMVNLSQLVNLILTDNNFDYNVIIDLATKLSTTLSQPQKDSFNLEIIDNPIVFPIDDAMKASSDDDIIYLSIFVHGIIPLDDKDKVITAIIPETINTIEIQRACSLSAVNILKNTSADQLTQLIHTEVLKPERGFKPEFVQKCKKIEEEMVCTIRSNPAADRQEKRFIERYESRYPPSKLFKNTYGQKYFYFNNKDYFKSGKGSTDWKVLMYVKKNGTILNFDITRYVLQDESKLPFFQSVVHHLINDSSDFSSGRDKIPYIFTLDNIVKFINTSLGYKNIKIIDFTCAVFHKEEEIKQMLIVEEQYLSDETASRVAEELDMHYGGNVTKRNKTKRKTTMRKKKK